MSTRENTAIAERSSFPEGWEWSTLGDVSEKPQYGWTTKANHDTGTLKLLRTTDITSGSIVWSSVPFCTEEPEDVEKYLVESGDILISRAGSVGVSFLINKPERAVFASYLIRFRPKKGIDTKYFYYYLKSPAYWDAIGASKSGIAVPNVNASKLAKVPIPVAPLDQQRRIVAEIEKQFSRLDEAIANLKRVKANLKRYKAAVLKAAVEGKLTEEWRKAHPDVEPASKLLERILAERRAKWEQAELAKMKTKGTEPKDDKWKKKYLEPEQLDVEGLRNLPNGWVWVTLEQLSNINPKIDKSMIPDDQDVSFVPMPEVGADNGHINVSSTRPFSEVKKGFTNFFEGDVLFAKITPCMENGKMAVVPPLVNGYGFGSTEFHVIRPFNGFNPYFVYYLVSSLSYRKEAAHHMTGAVGQKRVPVDFLKKTFMPLAPTKEQVVIITEGQRRLSIVERLDELVELNIARAERLRQSILSRAFSGGLGEEVGRPLKVAQG